MGPWIRTGERKSSGMGIHDLFSVDVLLRFNLDSEVLDSDICLMTDCGL